MYTLHSVLANLYLLMNPVERFFLKCLCISMWKKLTTKLFSPSTQISAPKENPYLSTNYSRQSCFLSLQELNALVLHGIGIIPISHKLYFFLAIPFQTSKWDNCPKSSLWYIWFTSSKQISKQNPSISFQDIHKWFCISLNSAWLK